MFPSKTLFLTRAIRLHETMQILLKKAEPSVYTSPTHHRQVRGRPFNSWPGGGGVGGGWFLVGKNFFL